MIGVFDSGYGGLSVLRHLLAAFPDRDFLYLGDSGRAPYGGRDVHTLLDFSEQAIERLFEEGCSLVVVACHTVSCVALRHLQRRYCPPAGSRRVLGVTIPAAEAAVELSEGHVGLIATHRTVASGTWATELAKLGSHRLSAKAAPLLAGIVEEGWEGTPLAREAVGRYLEDLPGIDTLVLGCTHYPLLRGAFEACLPEGVRLLDPAPEVAIRLASWMERHPGFVEVGSGRLRVLCTGDPAAFARHGERFLGRPLPPVEIIAEVGGRLAPRELHEELRGQVVREAAVRGAGEEGPG